MKAGGLEALFKQEKHLRRVDFYHRISMKIKMMLSSLTFPELALEQAEQCVTIFHSMTDSRSANNAVSTLIFLDSRRSLIDSGELMLHHFSSSDFFTDILHYQHWKTKSTTIFQGIQFEFSPLLWTYYAETFFPSNLTFSLSFGSKLLEQQLFFIFDRCRKEMLSLISSDIFNQQMTCPLN